MDEREDKIGAQHHRPVQAKKGRANAWTKAKRDIFLTELAASCNIRRASAAAGMWPTSAYKLRGRDAEFAKAWQAALDIGYERLETALVARALEAVGEIQFDTLDERVALVEKMTVDQAIRILGLHRESVRQGQARGRKPQARQIATQEETDEVLIKRIRMIERQRVANGQPSLLPPDGPSGEPEPA
jgi:hypothetical protein